MIQIRSTDESHGLVNGEVAYSTLAVIGTSHGNFPCESSSDCQRAVTDRGCAALVFDIKKRFTSVSPGGEANDLEKKNGIQ